MIKTNHPKKSIRTQGASGSKDTSEYEKREQTVGQRLEMRTQEVNRPHKTRDFQKTEQTARKGLDLTRQLEKNEQTAFQ